MQKCRFNGRPTSRLAAHFRAYRPRVRIPNQQCEQRATRTGASQKSTGRPRSHGPGAIFHTSIYLRARDLDEGRSSGHALKSRPRVATSGSLGSVPANSHEDGFADQQVQRTNARLAT
jgi:hypothetical protein